MLKQTLMAASAALLSCGLLNVAAAQPQDTRVDVEVGQQQPKVDVDIEARQRNRDTTRTNRDTTTNRRAKPSQGLALRATAVQDLTVTNPQGEELGSVNDIVINARTGRIQYAALSYGGILGVGDKLFAVPWGAFRAKYNPTDKETTLILALDPAILEKAPGFNQDQWPNFADQRIAEEIKTYYGNFRSRNRSTESDSNQQTQIEAQAEPGRVNVDVVRDREQAAEPGQPANSRVRQADILRSSEIMDMDVKGSGGEDIGSVEDLVIDISAGHVRYAALSYGGVLGVGDKLFAVPWSAFDIRQDANEDQQYLLLAISESKLKQAPGFNQDNWPNMASPEFGTEIDKYYGESQRPTDAQERIRPRRSNTIERTQPSEQIDE